MPFGRLLPARRSRTAAALGAATVTSAAVAIGVLAPGATPVDDVAQADRADQAAASIGSVASGALEEDRTVGTSRSEARVALAPRTPTVERRLWTTEALKLRVQPSELARDVGSYPDNRRIGVTGKRTDGYAEVVVEGKARWVSAEYLSRTKQPDTGADAAVDTSDCGKSASGGLQPPAQSVMNAVCHAFPDISTYGGYAPRGEHGGGMAVDVMVTGATGDQVAQFLYAHRGELGLSNIIWEQTIWSSERDGEGFRGMEDRGSATANHFDHVHVLVG